MRKYQRGDIGPLIFFMFITASFVFCIWLIANEVKLHNEQRRQMLPYEILSVRGCDYLQLNGKGGSPVAIIEVADQPSTCKYNIFKLSDIKKR